MLYDRCEQLFAECQRRVYSLELFSLNESLEDLETTCIPYARSLPKSNCLSFLELDYIGASLLSHFQSIDKKARLAHLQQSQERFRSFFDLCTCYELIDSDLSLLMNSSKDPITQRTLRIQRLQKIRDLKQIDPLVPDSDRQHKVNSVKSRLLEASTAMDIIATEMNLLSQGLGLACAPIPVGTTSASEQPVRRISQPFILLDKRNQVRQNVFRPGHALPTMTIDEYLAMERERGGILDQPTNRQKDSYAGEDDEAVVERLRQEAIRFDDFKDVTTRGSGNTRNLS